MQLQACPQNSNSYHLLFDLVRFTVYATVPSSSPPIANFVGTPTAGQAPLAVSFTDQSANTPTSWSWSFGDSNTSTAQNPSHTYSSNGSYTVALTATNQYGNNTSTKTNYVSLGNPPAANFSGTPTSGAVPLAVTFTDSSTNGPTAWSWNFGDSATSTAQNPSHTYNSVGTYTVALTATNAYGNNTNTKSNYLSVNPGPPIANFSGTPTTSAAPMLVTFTDSSTNGPTSWSWNFGDSSTSTAQNPTHTYVNAGYYTVALTATNAYGNNTCTKSNYITATGPMAPAPSFTSSLPTSGLAPLALNFTDTSVNNPTSWSWTFGDGGTSTAQNPSHTFTSAGMYTVALTATNSLGSNTASYTDWVLVRSSNGSFSMGATSFNVGNCSIVSGALSDTTTEDGTYLVTQCTSSQGYSVHFDFNVGYNPSQLSALHVEMKQHCSRSDTPKLTFYMAQPGTSWSIMSWPILWTTSDQWVVYDTTDVAAHMDSSNNIDLMICGCPTSGNSNNYTVSYDLVKLSVTVIPPVADFSGAPTSGLYPLAVSFTDASTHSPTAWSWSFGDLEHEHAAEPEPYLHQRGFLHCSADRDQRGREQYQHQDQLHQRHRPGPGRQLLRRPH